LSRGRRESAARHDWVRDIWAQSGPARIALAPAAGVYRLAMLARSAAFRLRLRSATSVGVPVVSVGNLTVGGTGKTPTALWLATQLRARGRRPAIVTRGYGGELSGRVVAAGTGAGLAAGVEQVGDEAALLALRFPGPVVCGVDRVAAAQAAVEQHGADVIVLDDGFQHWRLARDIDLVLVDGRHGFGNGAMLPAGPLREPLRSLARAGAILVTKATATDAVATRLERYAPGVPAFAVEIAPTAVVRSEEGRLFTEPLGALVGRRVVTVSGIANPGPFYEMLGQLEVRPVEVLEFPDHHPYSQSDWQRITQAAHEADLVVCTEKDLVKLQRFPFARGTLVALRVDLRLAEGDEARLLEIVAGHLDGPALLRPDPGHAS
jgi:tetraacyldisaccharide 4'-kinase